MSDALPSPDERLNAALKGMIDNLNAAATECPSLNASSDNIDIKPMETNVDQALDQFSVVKDIMK